MDKKEISFFVKGQDAETGANEIKKIINDEFEYEPQILADKENKPEGSTKAVDPIALGALILAVPAAILAVADLADRIKNKKKLDRVLEKIQKRVVQKKEVTVKIIYPNGMIKDISSVDSVEILDNFSR